MTIKKLHKRLKKVVKIFGGTKKLLNCSLQDIYDMTISLLRYNTYRVYHTSNNTNIDISVYDSFTFKNRYNKNKTSGSLQNEWKLVTDTRYEYEQLMDMCR